MIAHFPASGEAEVEAAVEAAAAAGEAWRAAGPIARGKHLTALATALRARGAELVEAMTAEQGKPLAESRGEVGKSFEYLDYYGGLAYEFAGRLLPSARPGVELAVRPRPLGVCALISPWNNPLAIPVRKLAPALLAGNTVVLKPSSETPLCAHLLAEATVEAGLPAGVVNVVHGSGAEVAEPLARHPRVRAISFTGSTAVGRRLATIAGERLVKVQLELGGKNASVVLDDADLAPAAEQITAAAFGTSGQQCTATSRVIAAAGVADRLRELLLERIGALVVGPGERDGTQIGPLVSERQLRTALSYVEAGRAEGATLLRGGERLEEGGLERGWFMSPALFTAVEPSMRIAREEIFGPVLALLEAADDAAALAIANDTDYGLSAAVYTGSLARAMAFVEGLEAGAVAVNLPSAGWEVQAPFGGLKDSGGSGWKEQGIEALAFFSESTTSQINPV